MSEQRGQYMKPGTPPPPTTINAAPETPAVGELFATAELIAKARAAGHDTLWAYIEHLEAEAREATQLREMLVDCPCVDETHMALIEYVHHDNDCMKPTTGLCSCGLDQVNL